MQLSTFFKNKVTNDFSLYPLCHQLLFKNALANN